MIDVITRTIYVPANYLGREVLSYICEHICCSIGDIRKIENVFRVPITTPEREVIKIDKILQKFGLA